MVNSASQVYFGVDVKLKLFLHMQTDYMLSKNKKKKCRMLGGTSRFLLQFVVKGMRKTEKQFCSENQNIQIVK